MTQAQRDKIERLQQLRGKVQQLLDKLVKHVTNREAEQKPLSQTESDRFFEVCDKASGMLDTLQVELEQTARDGGLKV